MNRVNLIFLTVGIAIGTQIMLCLQTELQVKKEMVVTIKNNTLTFKSNVNRDGDRYAVIVGSDTLIKGTMQDGVWK